MRYLLSTILASLLALSFGTCAQAETVVIVNPGNPVASLSRDQVVDIYMGRQLSFPNGNTALPIDLPPDSRMRSDFYQKLAGRSIAQINAYWARLLFTGRATPPRVLDGVQAVLRSVKENRDAIAYVDSDDINGKVKVIYRLK